MTYTSGVFRTLSVFWWSFLGKYLGKKLLLGCWQNFEYTSRYPVATQHKLNLHETFTWRTELHMNVSCTFNLYCLSSKILFYPLRHTNLVQKMFFCRLCKCIQMMWKFLNSLQAGFGLEVKYCSIFRKCARAKNSVITNACRGIK